MLRYVYESAKSHTYYDKHVYKKAILYTRPMDLQIFCDFLDTFAKHVKILRFSLHIKFDI